ncbi:unnamed protein product [Symbiodinium sp. CCMP2456]|nr:unnamed protein product [Symbiodinium sp. CCMP2456]
MLPCKHPNSFHDCWCCHGLVDDAAFFGLSYISKTGVSATLSKAVVPNGVHFVVLFCEAASSSRSTGRAR